MLLEPVPTKRFLEELEKIKAGVGEIYRWADKHIVGEDISPRDPPKELAEIIAAVSRGCNELESTIRSLENEEMQLMYRILKKIGRSEKLSEKEYYLCRAIGDLKPSSQNESEYETYLKSLP